MPGVTEEQIIAARRMTAIEFLRRYRPGELVKTDSRGEFELREHDSFKINEETSFWHWKSRDAGGKSALDYLIKVEGVKFVDAVLAPALQVLPPDEDTKILLNPSGRFVLGGPEADTGLTGRKLMVDSYGVFAPHGGGAFSGKDPTKVDRSGAYMARYIAKNLVAAGLCEKCQVTLAYAIGKAVPVMVEVDTFGTGMVCADDCLAEAARFVFGLTPAEIIAQLDLLTPRYAQTAAYGHFGKPEFPWERTDQAKILRAAVI